MSGRRVVLTLLGVLGFLAVVRGMLAVWGPEWDARRDIQAVARYLGESHEVDLRVVGLGSSRMRGAFLESEWARLSQVDAASVVNLSVSGATFFDILWMLREAGGLPSSVEHVVLELPRWAFNRNRLEKGGQPIGTPDQLRAWGTLADRLASDRYCDRLSLVGEWFWPLYQRRSLEAWISHVRSPKFTKAAPPGMLPQWRGPRRGKGSEEQGSPAYETAELHFHAPEMSGFAQRNLVELLTLLRQSEAGLVLVQLPARAEYWRTALAQPGGEQFMEEVNAVTLGHAGGTRTRGVSCTRLKECQLTSADLFDYGHMTRAGARTFTRWLFSQASD